PAVDRRLDALLPGGRNLLIVPLFLEGGYRLGILVLEHPGKGDGIKRWVVALVEQWGAHASLALHTAWLAAELQHHDEDSGAGAAQTLEQAVGRVQGSIEVMRTLIFELRPSVLDEKGLAAAIAEYGKELDSGMRVRVDSRLRREPSDETRLTLFRIAQEALVN